MRILMAWAKSNAKCFIVLANNIYTRCTDGWMDGWWCAHWDVFCCVYNICSFVHSFISIRLRFSHIRTYTLARLHAYNACECVCMRIVCVQMFVFLAAALRLCFFASSSSHSYFSLLMLVYTVHYSNSSFHKLTNRIPPSLLNSQQNFFASTSCVRACVLLLCLCVDYVHKAKVIWFCEFRWMLFRQQQQAQNRMNAISSQQCGVILVCAPYTHTAYNV